MRALYDGTWDDLVVAIVDWHKPILSQEFIERKLVQIRSLEAHLTSAKPEDLVSSIAKLQRALGWKELVTRKKESEDVTHDGVKLSAQYVELVSRIRALVKGETNFQNAVSLQLFAHLLFLLLDLCVVLDSSYKILKLCGHVNPDTALLRHSSPTHYADSMFVPKFDGTEGIADWALYNDLNEKLLRLRTHAVNLLLDISRANNLDTSKKISEEWRWDGGDLMRKQEDHWKEYANTRICRTHTHYDLGLDSMIGRQIE
jgi:hypothetical protein